MLLQLTRHIEAQVVGNTVTGSNKVLPTYRIAIGTANGLHPDLGSSYDVG